VGTSPSSATDVVLDASVLVRAFAHGSPPAAKWVDRVAAGEFHPSWPSHLYAEVANAALVLERGKRISWLLARAVVAETLRMPATVFSAERAVTEALSVGFARGLSVYDALYVVLAEALAAPLVTADRRLAAATEQAVLLPE
jgi:predicted nucleic acid-binding protein